MRMKRKTYEALLAPMQLELTRMAHWAQHTGQRIAVILEGRDTAGKGGVIKAISQHLNPRQCRVVALPKPTERETGQWYFQRYVPHLPAAGEIVLFDRSWYNRAGVERVMGYCSDAQYRSFLQQAPVFEQLLVDDGIWLFKYWLGVDQAGQEAALCRTPRQPAQGLEAVTGGCPVAPALCRLHRRPRGHAGRHPHPAGAMDPGRFQ
jgi:Uncharacterized conserved protein